jgi:hypothetical protein
VTAIHDLARDALTAAAMHVGFELTAIHLEETIGEPCATENASRQNRCGHVCCVCYHENAIFEQALYRRQLRVTLAAR